jgi:hypothetical protein
VEVPRDEIEGFARRMGPLVRANLDAMAIELRPSLEAATSEMRGVLKPGEWDRLRIVIGSDDVLYATPERYAYFKQLLGPGAGDRVSFFSPDGPSSVFFRQSPASRAFFGTMNAGREP